MEFCDELAVTEALKLDRSSIEGRPVFVSKCEDKKNKPPAAANFKVSAVTVFVETLQGPKSGAIITG